MIIVVKDQNNKETGINLDHAEYICQRGNTVYLGRFYARFKDDQAAANMVRRVYSCYEARRNVCRIIDDAEIVSIYKIENTRDIWKY